MSTDETSPRTLPLILLTCRPAHGDFRYHLAVALAELGHPLTYIFLKRQPIVTDMATGEAATWSLPRLIRHFAALRKLPRGQRPVVFNSTNLAFPMLSVLLRRISGTRWCFDMHDDLLYETRGVRRVTAAIGQRFAVAQSDAIVHAAATLQRLFPRSQHIGNGSALRPLPKTMTSAAKVLILASLDGRFDFPFMAKTATLNPDRAFEVWGRISRDDAGIKRELDALLAGHSNVTYHGPYSDPDLPGLLANYLVAFAPYRTGVRLTEFIDPLRFYHCLASQTGLVSTAIPQTGSMGDQVEVVRAPEEVVVALDRAATRRGGPSRTWADVAVRVSEILRAIRD